MFLSLFLSSCLMLLVNAVHYTPEVQTEGGKIRGFLTNLTTGHVVRNYLGIPFAKADRFKPPTNATKWSGVEDMKTFGKECPQIPSPPFGGKDMSEDCLNLNVFVPNNTPSGTLLPVMVWVHGGSYLFGSNRIYDGSYISSLGNVIVVAINYRLTVFGFLTTGENGDLKGNYGMLDQVQALRWVNRNIVNFGGDPNKVTIFGESAGGSSVSLLMLSPLTKGLFKNVIMQSGAATARWAAISYEQMANRTKAFGRRINCTNLGAMEECLKPKSFMEIIKQTTIYFSFVPVIDKHFLPDSPSVLLQKGQFEKYNVMVGVNNDEGTLMTNAVPGMPNGMNVTNGVKRVIFEGAVRSDSLKAVLNQKPPLPAAMIYRYTDWTNVNDPYRNRRMFMDMMADTMFVAPAIQSAKAFVNYTLPTYFYQLQYRADYGMFGHIPSWVGAYHGADISYVFGFPLSLNASRLYTKEANFSREVIKLWTNFAKTGNPNNPESIPTSWPQYDLNKQQYIALKPTMAIESKLRAEYVAFWNKFIPEILRSMPTAPPTTPPTTPSTAPPTAPSTAPPTAPSTAKPCSGLPSEANTITTNILVVVSAIITSQLGTGYF